MPKDGVKTDPAVSPSTFLSRKATILQSLAQSPDLYQDASPKGSVDEEIRDLIDEINANPACVTTSSCAGRISVFLEAGPRPPSARLQLRGSFHAGPAALEEVPSDLQSDVLGRVSQERPDSTSIKGVGGRWLYVSHKPIDLDALRRGELLGPARSLQQLFGIDAAAPTAAASESCNSPSSRPRYVHFKFEPMILHILTASLAIAQATLTAAQQAGFRESGVSNVTSPTPMVAVRTQGLALDSLVGVLIHPSTPDEHETVRSLVAEDHLCTLVKVAHARFAQNTQRISRFRSLLQQNLHPLPARQLGSGWEDPDVRRARKRVEGLRKQQILRSESASDTQQDCVDLDSGTEDMGLQP